MVCVLLLVAVVVVGALLLACIDVVAVFGWDRTDKRVRATTRLSPGWSHVVVTVHRNLNTNSVSPSFASSSIRMFFLVSAHVVWLMQY